MKKSIRKGRFCLICLFASLLFSLNFMGCDNPSVEEPDDSTQTEQSESEDDSSTSKPTTKTTPTTTTEEETDVSENPIKFTISIPASTNSITIERREVNKSTHAEISGWMTIATKWIENDAADYATAKNKDFTENYDVVKGHCYEYRVWTYNNSEGYGYNTRVSTNLGYHVAGYDGNKIPEITNAQFPLITYTQDATNVYLAVEGNDGDQLPITCHNDEEIENVTYDYSYGWKFSYFNSDERSKTISKADLRNGNNLLTSFNYFLALKGEYFNLERNIDVYSLNMEKIPFSIPGKLIEGSVNQDGLPGIYMEVSMPWVVVHQVAIERKESDEDDSAYKRIGFHSYDGDNSDTLKFRDFFDYETDKTYVYRAVYTLEDWQTKVPAELGMIQPSVAGIKKPGFTIAPEYSWNASSLTLSVTNTPTLNLSEDAKKVFIDNAADTWDGALGLSYKIANEESFWPQFNLFGGFEAANEQKKWVTYVREQSWGSYPDLSETDSENYLCEYALCLMYKDYIVNIIDLLSTVGEYSNSVNTIEGVKYLTKN